MTKEDKILEIINEYLTYTKVSSCSDTSHGPVKSEPFSWPPIKFHKSLKNKIYNMLDYYTIFDSLRRKGNKDYVTSLGFLKAVEVTLNKVIDKFDPKVTPEMASKKEIEVNGVNKKGIKTGKRTIMKFGRWLNQAFPFLTDNEKERLVDWYSDNYGPINATFHRATTGFEYIVTKPMGNRVGFSTTMWQKSLSDSCMRYDANELGLSEHPYSAYESGDWELCYLLDQNENLLGRCLVNLPTKTHSAIYGVSNPSIQMLKEEMHKLGYTQASEDAVEWDGSKLLYIEDTYSEDDEENSVFLVPYVDIFEGFAYHDRKYIYLSLSSDRPFNTHYVEPFESSGWNER